MTESDRLQPLQRILGFILPIIHRGPTFFLQEENTLSVQQKIFLYQRKQRWFFKQDRENSVVKAIDESITFEIFEETIQKVSQS